MKRTCSVYENIAVCPWKGLVGKNMINSKHLSLILLTRLSSKAEAQMASGQGSH